MNKYDQGWLDNYMDTKNRIFYYFFILACAALGFYFYTNAYIFIGYFLFALALWTVITMIFMNLGVFMTKNEKNVKYFGEELSKSRSKEFYHVREKARFAGYSYDDIWRWVNEKDKEYWEHYGFGLMWFKFCKDAENEKNE